MKLFVIGLSVLQLFCSFIPSSFAGDILAETAPANAIDVLKFKSAPMVAAPKIGLALGGGGTRGAAHVGVLEVLEKEGIKVDYIAGTSIGSIIGGLYAAGVPLETIRKGVVSGQLMHHFMTVSLPVRVLLAPVLYVPRLLGSRAYDGLYKGNKFRKYLEKTLHSSDKRIENLKVPFAAVSLNLLDGKPYMIRSGDLCYAMQASSAVPSLRKPVEMGDKLFVDGGVSCNLPVKQCRQMGADFVIAVNVDEPFRLATTDTFRKPGSVARRMIKWDLYTIDKTQEELADVVIHPDTEGIILVSTSKKAAMRALSAGEQAARDALPAIKEKLQGRNILQAEK